MVLRSIKDNISSKKWKDKNGIEWGYVSPGEFQKKTGGKVLLFGDIGKKGKSQGDILINDNKDEVPVYTTRQKIGFFEKVLGYVECVEESEKTLGFVRIIKVSIWKIILIILTLLMLFISTFFLISKQEKTLELDKAAVAYKLPEGAKNTDPNMIAMPGITEVIYKKSSKKVVTPLINPEGNDCYFSYKITLVETGEVIYQSKNLKPGMALIDFELFKDLEIGEYSISVLAEAISLSNPDVAYNAGQINATLKVVE